MSSVSQVIAVCCRGYEDFEETQNFVSQDPWSLEHSCCTATPALHFHSAQMWETKDGSKRVKEGVSG